ncbi:MAG TPA: NCS2 family permease [Ignavibacteriaceae bacterium]|nr:NCS2 family permease [Ignavibacteriaceae bacterium]
MLNSIDKYFAIKENNSDIKTEVIAGLTTFITMAYIIIVNPSILSLTGMDKGSVFVATIFSSAVATLIMGLYANVPFAQAPGMGLNAFFTFTVVFSLGMSWQQALAIVFICGVLNFIIVITNIRKMLIEAIPESLQYAIGAGIGLFIAYIGLKNGRILNFIVEQVNILHATIKDGNLIEAVTNDVIPSISRFNTAVPVLALIGVVVTVILMLMKIRGAILIGVIITTIIGIFTGVTLLPSMSPKDFLPPSIEPTFFKLDFSSLFANTDILLTALSLVFAFSLTDTFDTIGTFIGTGKKSGIFDEKDIDALEHKKGASSKMDRAMISDGIATSIGAIMGTSNVTTYVESASGISAGGRTGLTAVVVAICFLICLFFAPLALMVPAAATAAALIIVGILMLENVSKINWSSLEEAIPAFFTVVIMPFSYSISNGIAAGFIFYLIVKLVTGKYKEVHPILYLITGLFIINFIVNAL